MSVTFGKVVYTGHYWLIDTEPFVRSRLKRVFPRVPQQAADLIHLSATPENTRELAWFLLRFPMEVDRPDLMARLADEHRDVERRLSDLMAGHVPPPRVELAVPPREYQVYVDQMLEIVGGFLLADDLGTGKTVSAILPMVRPGNMPVLVVCPAHLPGHWVEQLAIFAPHLSTHVIRTTQPYDLTRPPGYRRKAAPAPMPDVLISSYHKLRGWAETLASIVKYVVFDEAQALRHPGTAIYAAAQCVARPARRRLALSATPIYNYGSELHHVIDVVAPGALGEYDEFVRDWCISAPGEKARLRDAAQFSGYLQRAGIMLRRTRAEVGRELPPLTKIVHTIDSDQVVLDDLGADAIELARVILRRNEAFRGEKMLAASKFDMLLRQATGIAKAPHVADFVRFLLDSEKSLILFGWHRAVFDIWLDRLAAFNPVMYTGSESPNQKRAAIEAFTSGHSRLLIMSLRSGNGTDGLQKVCRTGVHGELDLAYGVHEQCNGRFHRDEQTDPCTAYYLVSETGSDPVVTDILGLKREQLEGLRHPNAALTERIDTGENVMRQLARDFLVRRGIPLPEDTEVTPLMLIPE